MLHTPCELPHPARRVCRCVRLRPQRHTPWRRRTSLHRSRTLLTMGGAAGCRRPQLRLRVEIRPKSKFGESVRGTLQGPSRRAAPIPIWEVRGWRGGLRWRWLAEIEQGGADGCERWVGRDELEEESEPVVGLGGVGGVGASEGVDRGFGLALEGERERAVEQGRGLGLGLIRDLTCPTFSGQLLMVISCCELPVHPLVVDL